jgi:hypothetical protein
MAVCLASDVVHLEPEDMNSAWSILQQLFPVESIGSATEPGISKSLLGKVLLKVRARRNIGTQNSNTHSLRDQALYAAAGSSHHTYSSTMASHLPVTLTTAVEGVSNLQSSGNLFEDYDAIMQDSSSWPGLEGVDNSYGSWV